MQMWFTWAENHLGLWFYSKWPGQTSSWGLCGVRGNIYLSLFYFHCSALGCEFFKGESDISQMWYSNHNEHVKLPTGFLNWLGFIQWRERKGCFHSSPATFPKQILSFSGQINTSNIIHPWGRHWAKVLKDVRCKTFFNPFICSFFIDNLVPHFKMVELLISLYFVLKSYF